MSHSTRDIEPALLGNGSTHIYSPNSLRTRFNTLSFSGSYGWSLDGISSSEGKAAVYVSTLCLILSAICCCQPSFHAFGAFDGSFKSSMCTYMLVYEQNRNVLALGNEAVESSLNIRVLCLGIYDEEVLLCVRRLGDMLHRLSVFYFQVCSVAGGHDHTPTPASSIPVTVS